MWSLFSNFDLFYLSIGDYSGNLVNLTPGVNYQFFKNIEALLKTQFRVRFKNSLLSKELKELIGSDKDLLKKIHRVNRAKYLSSLYKTYWWYWLYKLS